MASVDCRWHPLGAWAGAATAVRPLGCVPWGHGTQCSATRVPERSAFGSGRPYYGGWHGKAALIRPNPNGTWRVKVNDPRNRLAGHDGWVLLGDDYPSVAAAAEATGVG